MIYISYNINTEEFIPATNIAALSRATGVPYYKLYRNLSNGNNIYKHEDYIFGKSSELLKGNQRIPEEEKKSINDFFDEVK